MDLIKDIEVIFHRELKPNGIFIFIIHYIIINSYLTVYYLCIHKINNLFLWNNHQMFYKRYQTAIMSKNLNLKNKSLSKLKI